MDRQDQLFFARFLALFIAFGVLAYLADVTSGGLHAVLVFAVVVVWVCALLLIIQRTLRRRSDRR